MIVRLTSAKYLPSNGPSTQCAVVGTVELFGGWGSRRRDLTSFRVLPDFTLATERGSRMVDTQG